MNNTLSPEVVFDLSCMQEEGVIPVLLLDGAANDGTVMKTVFELEADPQIFPLYKDTDHEALWEMGPVLVPALPGSPLLNWYLQEGAHTGLLLCVHTNEVERLAKHLQPHTVCVLPNDEYRNLRFYDPCIMYYFWQSLSADEQAAFIGPCRGLVCIDSQAEEKVPPHAFVLPPQVNYQLPEKPLPWFISEATCAALEIPATRTLAKMLEKDFMQRYGRTARTVGHENVRGFVKDFAAKMSSLGFSSREDALVFMNCAVMLGADCLHDPQHSWVADAMNIEDSRERADALTQELQEYIGTLWGKDGMPEYRSIYRAWYLTEREYKALVTDDQCTAFLQWVFPEKAAYIGVPALRELIALAREKVKTWNLPEQGGVSYASLCMFFMGSGCDTDWLCPWFTAVIGSDECSPERRFENLLAAGQRMLRYNIKSIPQTKQAKTQIFAYLLAEQMRVVHPDRGEGATTMREYLTRLVPVLQEKTYVPIVLEQIESAEGQWPTLPPSLQAMLILDNICSEVFDNYWQSQSRAWTSSYVPALFDRVIHDSTAHFAHTASLIVQRLTQMDEQYVFG